MAATVKILLDEQQEFYVPGDTISGRVRLTSVDPSYSYKELTVQLTCDEYCNTRLLGKHERRSLTVPAKDNFAPQLQKSNANGGGPLEYEFTIVVDYRYTPLCPPSFTLTTSGNEIVWRVRAQAQIEEKEGTTFITQTIKDTRRIKLYPDAVLNPRIKEFRERYKSGSDGYDYNLDYRLPQWPEKFPMRLKFHVPREAQTCLRICLITRAVIMKDLESDIIVESTIIAQMPEVKISETSEPIEISCQLRKRQPAAFTSRVFHVRYLVYVQLTCDPSIPFKLIPVDLMPPSPESRASPRQLLLKEKELYVEPPPEYSK